MELPLLMAISGCLSFLPQLFSPRLAALTTQLDIKPAAPAASELVNACLGFYLYPYVIFH